MVKLPYMRRVNCFGFLIFLPLTLFHSLPQAFAMGIMHLASNNNFPQKHHHHTNIRFGSRAHISSCWMTLLTLFACASMLRFLFFTWQPMSILTCPNAALSSKFILSNSMAPYSALGSINNFTLTATESEFWKQPGFFKFVPCIEPMSIEYRQASASIVAQKEKFLVVVVDGGLNQQRNQIVDAVVIARILGASLVLPILQVNPIWEDESEFGDIFDTEHFKETLKTDVRIVTSLPSTHIMYRPLEEKNTPSDASPRWLRAHYSKQLRREGALLLRGLDSRLTKDLPLDLQRLRCKVAFHALKFAAPIHAVGEKLAKQMSSQGPYVAVHLRLEKDVWVRTGCLPGIRREFDDAIRSERKTHPKLLTSRGANLGFRQRKMSGLCPLTGAEVARLLKALGASERTRIFWAGGTPLGGDLAIEPIKNQFPHLFNKESLASSHDLAQFRNKASSLAAIDFLVCLASDVFLQSHGGNFGHMMQGHRAFLGHRKHIVPNKRQMLPHFLNATMSSKEFEETIRSLHTNAVGQPIYRRNKRHKDVLAYPVPECMCQQDQPNPKP